jgi:predicted DNA-binding transcriptional regulator YafY
MRDMLGAPIEYDFFKKGFFYTQKTFRLPAAYVTADDLLALGMAKNLMDLYRNTPIHEAALNLLESISTPLQTEQNAEWFKDRIVIPKTAHVALDTEIWDCIVNSLRENRIITFQYTGSEKKNIRRVRPYQMLFDRNVWFLFAHDEDRNEMRIFTLSRMSEVTLTDKKFTMPKGFDYRNLEGTSYFGVFTGIKTYKFVIAISGDTRWIRERIWADDQKIKSTRSGIELSFTSHQLDKVLDWILSQTPRARPLAPKILVERWKFAIQEAAKLIGKDKVRK